MPEIISKIIQIRSRLNRFQRDVGWRLGFDQNNFIDARGARILVYHGVCPGDPLRFNTLFIKSSIFEEHLRLYKKYFNIISLDDMYDRRFNNDRLNICLTFDDGFANNYRYVLPLLEQYQVPASFFITGVRDAGYDILWNDVLCLACKYGPEKFIFGDEAFVKGGNKKYVSVLTGQRLVDKLRQAPFEEKGEMMELLGWVKRKAAADYWMQLSTREIRSLSASKWVTIGSHSYHHNDLATMPAEALKGDLEKSKQFLEGITGKQIRSLAFPYGSHNSEAVDAAKKAGFTQLLATECIYRNERNDATLRERLTVNPFISAINQLHANIKGNYA